MCVCVEEGEREKNDNDDRTLKGNLGWIVIFKTFPVDLENFALIVSTWLRQAAVKDNVLL